MVIANWSGSYPTKCVGEWTLSVGGIDYSYLIPEDKKRTPMNTAGVYSKWYFNENWTEVFEDYEDGLEFDEWLAENPWVQEVPALALDIFLAFQDEDWRYGQCGGCI